MTDERHEVEWRDQNLKRWDWFFYQFVWLYGRERNELLLHHTANVHVSSETQEQLDRVTHWSPGPNPSYDEIYLPYPPKED